MTTFGPMGPVGGFVDAAAHTRGNCASCRSCARNRVAARPLSSMGGSKEAIFTYGKHRQSLDISTDAVGTSCVSGVRGIGITNALSGEVLECALSGDDRGPRHRSG